MVKENYTVRLEPTKKRELDQRAAKLGLGKAEHAVRLLELDLGHVQQNELTFMTMESPCYYMDTEFHVTRANHAATALFGIQQSDLQDGRRIAPETLVERLREFLELESYEREYEHFVKRFWKRAVDETGRIDESPELVRATYPDYGKVDFFRRGIRRRRGEWVVVWNIRSIENQEDYRRRLRGLIEAWLLGYDG